MGKITGFKEFERELPDTRKPKERIGDYKEFYLKQPDSKVVKQAARCMDCGVPFCHSGCPLGNNIPEFNDAVYKENWKYAFEILNTTNNFPEFTGRICPAPCESSCVLGINKPPIAIEYIEKSIVEKAFELDLVKPQVPVNRTGKKVAVIGSGPAGLAAASQLNKSGHWVTVFERDSRIGGLLRFGIPDFKLEKWVIDRRIKLMEAEGIIFRTNANVGERIPTDEILIEFDAVLLAGGSTIPRDIPIPGRDFKGIHFAMDFLKQQNDRVTGITDFDNKEILATGKNVVVIGGGDTGADCVGTSNRQHAKSVMQVELMGKPPIDRSGNNPWPQWPLILRTSSSHEEGCDRNWALLTKEFLGDENGNVKGLKVVDIKFNSQGQFSEIENSEKIIDCDLALLAIGFAHPQKKGLVEDLGLELDNRGNVKCNNFKTSVENVFAAGDMRRGQSLVVWAISEGREAARALDLSLMANSDLEGKDMSNFQLQP